MDALAGEGAPQLLVARGRELQQWAFPQETPLRSVAFEATGGELLLRRAPSGLFWAAFSRAECLLLSQQFELAGRYASPCFHDCCFPDEAGRFLACTEREADEYTTTLHLLSAAGAQPVQLRLSAKAPKPPARFVSISGEIVAHFSTLRRLGVHLLSGDSPAQLAPVETEWNISDFAVVGEELVVLSNDAALVQVFGREGAGWSPRLKRDFNNVQELRLHAAGPFLLVQAHRFTDKSNSSYYGLERLFRRKQGALAVVPTHRGAVHDCQVNNAQNTLVVVSGKMPSHTLVYDAQCRPFYLLNNGYRNHARFSPDDRFLALAGLGSLNGDIDVFCAKTYRQIGRCTSSHASFLKWSADSRLFLTAIVLKKLKVDHCVSLYTFDCKLLRKVKLSVFDLIDVDFLRVPPAAGPPAVSYLEQQAQSQDLLSAHLEQPHALSEEEVQRLYARPPPPQPRPVGEEGEAPPGEETAPPKPKKKERVLTRRRE